MPGGKKKEVLGQGQSLWKVVFHSFIRVEGYFWSYTTIHSNQKITFCIWHRHLCHPWYKHKTIWKKIILLYWPICLEQSASIRPPLWFLFIIHNCSWNPRFFKIVSNLSFFSTAIFVFVVREWCVCVCMYVHVCVRVCVCVCALIGV